MTVESPTIHFQALRDGATGVRLAALRMIATHGQGDLGQALGAAEIVSVLYNAVLGIANRGRSRRYARGGAGHHDVPRSGLTRRGPRYYTGIEIAALAPHANGVSATNGVIA